MATLERVDDAERHGPRARGTPRAPAVDRRRTTRCDRSGAAIASSSDDAAADFDVRWDETGEWVAVWVADPRDPAVGRLTPVSRRHRRRAPRGRRRRRPTDVAALPGFSIGDGRLAWATPRGQGGEGSRIQIAAWSDRRRRHRREPPGEEHRRHPLSRGPPAPARGRARAVRRRIVPALSCDQDGWS